MISLQTNVDSMVAQSNLSVDSAFQSKNIRELTSGYRINSSADDAAGLAVANQYRSNIVELAQGVNNASTGLSQLQIVDGGLSNISTMLDRMKTLATQSASTTFTGSRATLDQEFQTLKTEITRQATNVGLVAGGKNATNLSVYIGGGNSSTSMVSVDLSAGLVDATSLGLGANSTINTGGGGTVPVSATAVGGLTSGQSVTSTGTTFTINSGSQQASVSVTGTATVGQFLGDINSQIAKAGISGVTADLNSSGQIEFQGSNFVVGAITDGGTSLFNTGTGAATASGSMYNAAVQTVAASTANQTITFTVGGQAQAAVTVKAGSTTKQATDTINAAMNQYGVYATVDSAGTGMYFEGTSQFVVNSPATANGFIAAGIAGVASAATTGNGGTIGNPTQNATNAINAINAAISTLGTIQGTVGAGENLLNYATSLANSQITNFSSAQSSIRDANVAADASNLTKSQTLQQTAIAAMAQANSEAQSVLKLLQ